jgi:hypothetical protein
MNKITASGSGRLLQCSGHLRLPWVRETSAAAQEGTDLHELMELGRHHENPRALAAWEAWQAWKKANGWVMPSWETDPTDLTTAPAPCTEVAYALDLERRTARSLASSGHRDYSSATDTEICGTADLVTQLAQGVTWASREPTTATRWAVVDWKFGAVPVEADSAQMRTLAAMVMLHEQAESVLAIIVQSPPEGSATVRTKLFTRDDLMAHVEMLAESANEVREGAVQLQRGPECTYCPAVSSCPVQLAKLSQLVAPNGIGTITPARAGEIWIELRQAKKRLEAIEDACKELAAAEGGLPLPGGKRLTLVQRTRSSIDAKQLEAIARGHGASDEEIDACRKATTYTTTQESKP